MKTTSMCNLGCKYCFARPHFKNSVMTDMLIERILKEIDSLGLKSVDISWHGGEPLLLGTESFRRGVAIQRQLETSFKNHVQTNGLLINDEWAGLFKELGFGVGLSIDGYQLVHDFSRPLQNGKGSHTKVMRGLQVLQEHGVRAGVISVVGKTTNPQQYFDFIRNAGVGGFNLKPCSSSWEGAGSIQDFTSFNREVFKMWVENDDRGLLSRQYMGYAENILGGRAKLCSQSGRCETIMSIDTDGSVYPCDELISPRYLLGNILDMSLAQILESAVRKKFMSDLRQIHDKCKEECTDFVACRGGCTQEREFFGDIGYCASTRAMIASVRDWVERNGGGDEKNGIEPLCSRTGSRIG